MVMVRDRNDTQEPANSGYKPRKIPRGFFRNFALPWIIGAAATLFIIRQIKK